MMGKKAKIALWSVAVIAVVAALCATMWLIFGPSAPKDKPFALKNTPTPTHVLSGGKDDKESPSASQSADDSSADTPTREVNTADKSTVDAHLDEISGALTRLYTSEWTRANLESVASELSNYNVRINTDSLIDHNGVSIATYSNPVVVYAGWLRDPIECGADESSNYVCAGYGDYGFLPTGPDKDAQRYVDRIHSIMATDVHGKAGSEREIKRVVYNLKVSPDRKSGEVTFAINDEYSL